MEGLEFLEATLRHSIWVTLWGKLYRRELFDNGLNHHPLRLGQDTMINIQIACRLPRVHFIDYVGYDYVQRPSSSNHRSFDFDYCCLFCSIVERELQRHGESLRGQAEFYALLNKVRWYSVYVCKSRSPWVGTGRLSATCANRPAVTGTSSGRAIRGHGCFCWISTVTGSCARSSSC